MPFVLSYAPQEKGSGVKFFPVEKELVLFYFDECDNIMGAGEKGRCFCLEQEKGNFKGRVFGGFNRRDVIAYIESLAKERNALAMENQTLRGRVDALEERLEERRLPDHDELVLARAREVLRNANGILDELKRSYGELCGDININISQADHELKAVAGKLAALQDSLRAAGERLEGMSAELEIMPLEGAEAADAEDL